MSTWRGWRAQLLTAAGLPNQTPTREWLGDWAKHSSASCHKNPIDLSAPESGSGACKTLDGGRVAQRYVSHADAAAAFTTQIHSGAFPHLLSALQGQVLWEPASAPDIYADLKEWGSTKFAAWYREQFHGNWGSGVPGGALPQGHKGFADFQHALATAYPTALKRSKIVRHRILHQMRVHG